MVRFEDDLKLLLFYEFIIPIYIYIYIYIYMFIQIIFIYLSIYCIRTNKF